VSSGDDFAQADDALLAGVFRRLLTRHHGITVIVWPGVRHALLGIDGAEMKVNEAELHAVRRAACTRDFQWGWP
jgi:hypothetical protein